MSERDAYFKVLYQTAKRPNFLLLRLRGYDLKRDTPFITVVKAIKMIHAISSLYSLCKKIL